MVREVFIQLKIHIKLAHAVMVWESTREKAEKKFSRQLKRYMGGIEFERKIYSVYGCRWRI
jgi:hypothetical protein